VTTATLPESVVDICAARTVAARAGLESPPDRTTIGWIEYSTSA
jgi:hypothetical protein